LHHGVESLGAGGLTDGVLQTVTRRGVAHACAGIDVVVAEAGAHQLLHQVGLLVRAARRGDTPDRVAAILRLDTLQLARSVADRLFPAHLTPWIADPGADHGLDDPIGMSRVADGKAPLDAGMTVIGVPVLVRHHADELLALHLGAEGATHPAIGTGSDDT